MKITRKETETKNGSNRVAYNITDLTEEDFLTLVNSLSRYGHRKDLPGSDRAAELYKIFTNLQKETAKLDALEEITALADNNSTASD